MAKDYFENELQVGDTVVFNSTIQTKFVIGRIESINESHSTVDIEYDGWCIERSCNDVIKFNGYIDHDGDIDVMLPHTIGDITFYNKEELIEWIENQQKFNKTVNNYLTYKINNFLLDWIEEHMGTKAEAKEAIKIKFNIEEY